MGGSLWRNDKGDPLVGLSIHATSASTLHVTGEKLLLLSLLVQKGLSVQPYHEARLSGANTTL